MIDGVVITPLKQFRDDRGTVMHMLRRDSDVFREFGEIYFSSVTPGVVKGWKLHQEMVQNFAVPVGNALFVLFDDRDGSPTQNEVQEVLLGEDNYRLLTLPPKIWYGFQATGNGGALIANCASIPHDPVEAETRDWTDPKIPYNWASEK